ncbi:YhgE/Pip domain-containing protein [Rhodococcus sp. D2-41]|uniref:YhgE/Pip domain-containing protein n=1 Tax=Speluncibacter jeojiensis TaxID=2710754 RepID=A0A9X4M409_9ACTN|nr:YhgE/Pip domain-containing protein [Rhodococcus sp. D2-41]MDG3010249.1 YhgE/Pip domain-containing protein [Rhodococcus sp. D2-41]MDG3015762.1 YhgE/Pip domain-containing protein [Corynebacteriales bacterium D3-21]
MFAGFSIGTELKRFRRGKMPKIALVAIVFMPLLYGAMYLWAFWNPFGQVQKLPVALVNDDRGALVSGQELRAGDQVAAALLKSGDLGWREVSAEEARDGVAHGRYYFSVELPTNFSKAVSSPTTAHPQKAELKVTFNDANNYLGSVIGQNAMNQVLHAVSTTISTQAVDQVLVGLGAAGGGLQQAADGAGALAAGAGQLDGGIHQLTDGAKTLSAGIDTARSGSVTLADGTTQLSAGIDAATAGSQQLTDGLGRLAGGAAQLGDGAQQISGGVDQLVGQLTPLGDAQAQAATTVGNLAAAMHANPDPLSQQAAHALDEAHRLLTSQGFDQATMGRLGQLRDGARQLAFQLDDPSSPFRSGLTQAVDGGSALHSGLVQLGDGGRQVDDGAHTLSGGLGQLSDGGHQLVAGTGQLTDGSGKLKAGSTELAQKLSAGTNLLPTWSDSQRQKVASTIGGPVALDSTFLHRAATFGTGFAPFFLPLALFVGGIIIWMLLRPLQSRPISAKLGALRVVLASYWPAALIGIAQVIVMFLVVRFAVGMHTVYTWGTIGFLALIALTYLALIQAFNAIFGVPVGRVVTLAFLMLQLVSSGGVYPVQTTAKPFQILHVVDPMTYAVNGLRQLTVGGVDNRLWIAIAVLGGLLLVSLAAGALSVWRDRRWTFERLHPPLTV